MSEAEKNKIRELFSTCSGPSMYPTLKNGDGIRIVPFKAREDIQVGDIIVYPHPEKSFDVVHRVIKIKEEGFITRGDNNNKIDPYVVEFDKIKGKIESVKRKDKILVVIHGKGGYFLHKTMLLRKVSAPFMLRPLQFISTFIDKSNLFKFLHIFFKTKKITVSKKGKREVMLILNKKVIGRKIENNEWKIRFPYKYFINKDKIR